MDFVEVTPRKKIKHTSQPIIWWKVGKHFIKEDNIRALSRKGFGKGTEIRMFEGEDLFVDVDYDKLIKLLPLENKN